MPKPVLFTVDDDPEVLRAIERDLRSHYSDRYRVMRASSGSAFSAEITLSAGARKLSLQAQDRAGNIGPAASVAVP